MAKTQPKSSVWTQPTVVIAALGVVSAIAVAYFQFVVPSQNDQKAKEKEAQVAAATKGPGDPGTSKSSEYAKVLDARAVHIVTELGRRGQTGYRAQFEQLHKEHVGAVNRGEVQLAREALLKIKGVLEESTMQKRPDGTVMGPLPRYED